MLSINIQVPPNARPSIGLIQSAPSRRTRVRCWLCRTGIDFPLTADRPHCTMWRHFSTALLPCGEFLPRITVQGDAMAKDKLVWVIRWTHCEYGGPSAAAAPSYHATREEAEAYRSQREGDPVDVNRKFFEDGFRYVGSEPTPELVKR